MATNHNQVICIKCGISLKKELGNFDDLWIGQLLKNTQVIFALLALLGYFLPWVGPYNGMEIQKFSARFNITGGELLPLLFLFPLSLVGVIITGLIPEFIKIRKILTISSVVLIFIGLFSHFIIMNNKRAELTISDFGFGLYLSLIATIVSAYFGFKKTNR